MINITDKSKCCGCNACVQKCPKQCISMHEDEEGFLYPKVNMGTCIDCGLCEKVCPVINQMAPKNPLSAFATQHEDKTVRLQSSSGGFFSLIATSVLNQGGVVFGARWNQNMQLIHTYTETTEGLAPFRRSKYIQSDIGNTFKQVEQFLKTGRLVLFTGVACQIAGLKNFLRKPYDNLLTVDVICHGVPSRRVFHDHLKHLAGKRTIIDFNFRDKTTGWKGYSIAYTLDNGTQGHHRAELDEFMRGFLNHYMLRPSCHHCPAKSGKCGSDITLGDLWGCDKLSGINDDDTGLSLVIVNTQKGLNVLEHLNIDKKAIPICFVRKNNNSYFDPTASSPLRSAFWSTYNKNGYITLAKYNEKLGHKIKDLKWLYFKVSVKRLLKNI